MDERELNQQAAEQIMSADGLNGKPYRPGDWVALLDGKVVGVAEDLDDAVQVLRRVDPDPKRGMIFRVGPPLLDVIR
jgi:hypothetical protein